jgi:hypothetical protein
MPLRNRPELQHSIVNSAAGGTLAISGAGAGAFPSQRIAVFAMAITVGAAVNVTLQDTGAVALSQPFQFLGTSPPPLVLNLLESGQGTDPRWITSANGVGIQLNASGAVQVSADIWWLPVT